MQSFAGADLGRLCEVAAATMKAYDVVKLSKSCKTGTLLANTSLIFATQRYQGCRACRLLVTRHTVMIIRNGLQRVELTITEC